MPGRCFSLARQGYPLAFLFSLCHDTPPSPALPTSPPPESQKQDFIRGQDGGLRSEATREAHERGLATLQAYCSGAACRHAALVNYFQPGLGGGGAGGRGPGGGWLLLAARLLGRYR
jgi:hypothetical protein